MGLRQFFRQRGELFCTIAGICAVDNRVAIFGKSALPGKKTVPFRSRPASGQVRGIPVDNFEFSTLSTDFSTGVLPNGFPTFRAGGIDIKRLHSIHFCFRFSSFVIFYQRISFVQKIPLDSFPRIWPSVRPCSAIVVIFFKKGLILPCGAAIIGCRMKLYG